MAQLKMLKEKKSKKRTIAAVEETTAEDNSVTEETPTNTPGTSENGDTEQCDIETTTIVVPEKTDADAVDTAGDFTNFALTKETIAKLKERGVERLFPVQQASFRPMYKGKDMITQARTGTGKTLSFVLPLVSRIMKDGVSEERGRLPTVLVMAPTRELAVQINDDFKSVVDANRFKVSCFYGGTSYYSQEAEVRRGIDVLVGTPGRLMDLAEKGTLLLHKVRHIVIDEADRMLEIGFKDHMDKIIAYCFEQEKKPQFCLFSATMPSWVQQVARKNMDKPKRINLVTSVNKTSNTVQHLAIRCMWQNRTEIIGDIVQQYSGKHGRAIVFTQTKAHANELSVSDFINQEAQVLHGDIVQKQRELRLQGFRDGKFQVLVATDVAARGLDIPQIDLVVQCEPPKDVDDYIHRSGRTGRAGRVGISVLLYNSKQEGMLNLVERQAGIKFDRVAPPQPTDLIQSAATDAAKCLREVPKSVIPEFLSHAKELLETMPAEEVVAAALAHISGVTEIKKRSLLSTQEGFIAYEMTNSFEVRSPYYFWNALEEALGAEFRAAVSTMRLTADKTGCVIDVPEKFQEFITTTWEDHKNMTLSECTELPALEQFRNDYTAQRSYGRGRGGGGYGGRGRGSYGGNRNGGGGGGGFKRRNDYSNGNAAKRTKF